MLNELLNQVFKMKLFGLKHKFRFLKGEEIIQEGDCHFKVAGYGVYEFKSKDSLMGYLENHSADPKTCPWETKVVDYLKENMDEYKTGYKLILIARILDGAAANSIPQFFPVTTSAGESILEYPMRVFVRRI